MRVTRESPITVLDGVGRVKAEHYAKMGIYTLGDLILHYPRAYENRGDIVTLEQARPDGKSALILTVATEARVVRLRSHKSFLKFRAFDDSGSCEIVYFNQDYLKSQFCIGSVYRFFGKVERKGGKYSMSSPVAEPWTPTAELPPLWAVYRMTEGITPKQIAKDVASAFELLAAESEDPIPAMLLQKRSLCTLAYAEHNIHKPASWEALATARRRLVYDEFFCFSLGAAITHRREKAMGAPVCQNGEISALTDGLPYALTGAQQRAIEDVRRDMKKNVPMSRIIVGDVGCGKTVCAAAAILISVQNGRQAAMMAPTEILARQHYADLAPYFLRWGIRASC
jgi:ATP-dependent DNA helicase RecG